MPAGQCLWCGNQIYYEHTKGAPFQKIEAVEQINKERVYAAYRAHMISNHPAVLEVLGT